MWSRVERGAPARKAKLSAPLWFARILLSQKERPGKISLAAKT
jgi:hypothetical protein